MKKPKDRIWLVMASSLILIYSSIPNWVGYASETEILSFKGIFFDPQDYAVHRSMIRSGMQGNWTYQFRFTTEPHQPAYTRLFYVVLGESNRLLHLDPAILFEITRWIFGFTALAALYSLMGHFFKEVFWRRIAFLLAVFGSGLGWLQLILGWTPGPFTPIDFWLIDAYVLFGIALFPHFAFVTAAICLVFLLYLDFLDKGGWHRIEGICVVAILTQFVNPIVCVLVDAAIACTTLLKWIQNRKIEIKQAIALGAIAAAQLPLLIYNVNLLTHDPLWSLFTRQNETISPPPVYYFWGFGLLWLFSLVGLFSMIQKKHAALFGATAWIVTGLLLSYAPLAIQRRFLHGVTIPLALLSVEGVRYATSYFAVRSQLLARRTRSIVILLAFFASFSIIYLVLGRSLFLRGHPAEFFYPASLNSALAWLDEHAPADSFVLCSAPSGLLVAQETDLRVYLGHPMETLYYLTRLEEVETFFRGNANPGWLENSGVKWILVGPYEQDTFGLTGISGTNTAIVYMSEEVAIYRVGP
ncbi:MAG: hypothetical protein FJZ87_00735 [Chloroflexi bacterium]|nr:hypothetical protein [Chloroflexota bacterium]